MRVQRRDPAISYPFVLSHDGATAAITSDLNQLRAVPRNYRSLVGIIDSDPIFQLQKSTPTPCNTTASFLYYNSIMPISVRLPPRVEQKLVEYCLSHRVTKSEAVKRALEQLLASKEGGASPYELGREFFERNLRTKPTHDIARHTKRLLIEHFRGKRR